MSVRMAIEVSNIQWDADIDALEDLPSTMAFEVELPEEDPSETEINTAATDHMSEATGWCVNAFTFDSVKKLDAAAPAGP